MTEESAVDRRNDIGSPLSFGQERLWLAYVLEPRSPSYNVPVCLRLLGRVDVRALEQSLTEVVRRHDILRTSIFVANEEPRQRVAPPTNVRLAVTDLQNTPLSGREDRAMEIVSEEAERPFDLRRGPVFRASLIRTGETEYVFLFVVHHIAFDGWSQDVFVWELTSLYESFKGGKAGALPDLPRTYADYAAWQREFVETEAAREGLAYWRDLVGDNPQLLDLPTDHPRPKARSSRGHTTLFRISPSVAEALKPLAKSESTTLYVTLLAAFVALLHRYTGQDDIVIGTPVAGRTRSDLGGMIGFFVNTVPLRTRIGNDPSFRELIRQVRTTVVDGLTHQDVPLEELTKDLHLTHDLGWTPLFQVLFTLETFARAPAPISGVQVEMVDIFTETAKFDLALQMRETDDGLLAIWEYSTELFEEETVRRMSAHLTRLLEHVADHPDTRLSDLPLLGEEERRRMLVDWNSTEREYPRQSCIHELFEEQVGLGGGRVALVSGKQQMTYAELNQCANRLAHWLCKAGVHRGVPVGLCLNRSLDMVVGILAILKAGGAYVPLDPKYPHERIRYMVNDTNAPVVITDSHLAPNVPADGRRILCLDLEHEHIARESPENLPGGGRSDDLAYIMYTSGSTGKPKGVCVVHRGVVRLVKGIEYASLGPDEVFLQLATFTFDVSTFEIWGCLLNGGRLILGPHRPSHDEIGRLIRDGGATTLWLTAGLFHNVVDAGLEALSGLSQLLVGGDVVSTTHAAQFKARYPDCRLVNGYGPTENTTFTTCYDITGKELGPLPIGRPLPNTTVYILDSHLKPVPVGVVGELCTGGDGLARGYLDDAKLTAERFVTVPGLDAPLVYRTGDLARYRADGLIEFEGRRDNQVKVSGYRVETEEVEAILQGCPGVAQASVTALPSPGGDKQLVAYCVPETGTDLSVGSLRAFMRERAPAYMVPALFVTLPGLPLNAQGKVDRSALPQPVPLQSAGANLDQAPRDALEMEIASIWKRLFAIASVGIEDNFFDLGGHSLLAFRFFAALEESTGARLPLATLFEAPTIEQLAAIVRDRGWQPRSSGVVPLKSGGSRPPVFFVHAGEGNVWPYRALARHLDPDQPVLVVEARGLDGEADPLTRVEDMAELYITQITAVQPHGPYTLGGSSIGGVIAFEMARRLVERGEPVSLVALFDSFISQPTDISRVRFHAHMLLALPPRKKLDHIRGLNRELSRRITRRPGRLARDAKPAVGRSFRDAQQRVNAAILLAALRYANERRLLPAYPGAVTLFLAADRANDGYIDPTEQWKGMVLGEIETIRTPGNHVSIMMEPQVRVLAERLDALLARPSLSHPKVSG